MPRNKSFDNTKFKFRKVWEEVEFNKSEIDSLPLIQNLNTNVNTLQRYLFNTIDHTPVVFDLYNWLGVTFTTAETSPEPTSLYQRNALDTGWEFILPIFGYRIPHQADVETITGSSDWEFNTSVVASKTKVFYQGLTERTLDRLRVVTILSARNQDQLLVPISSSAFKILIDPINNIFTNYSIFTRWVKQNNGYDLEVYSFYPLLDNLDIKLTTKVYGINKEVIDEIQPFKIQNTET